MLRSGFGTTMSGSTSSRVPRPEQPAHAPCGALNENIAGVSSMNEMPQVTQAYSSLISHSRGASVSSPIRGLIHDTDNHRAFAHAQSGFDAACQAHQEISIGFCVRPWRRSGIGGRSFGESDHRRRLVAIFLCVGIGALPDDRPRSRCECLTFLLSLMSS